MQTRLRCRCGRWTSGAVYRGTLFAAAGDRTVKLQEAAAADGVPAAVPGTIRDHAAAEGRHHACFASFLRLPWRSPDRDERRRAGPLLPWLMDTFLRPGLPALSEGPQVQPS
jgi:hypothetical protein